MKILLTNDDGIDAEGLQELAKNLSKDHECWIVAPDIGRSCCSHAVTNTSQLHLTQQNDRSWTLSGTPADCIRIALHELQLAPDLVISGVNHGGNLGIDTLFSGTVAGAREASIHRLPAIALSQYMRAEIAKDWRQSAIRARRVLESLWHNPHSPGRYWNVNLPAIPPEENSDLGSFPISHCELERAPLAFVYNKSNALSPDGAVVYEYQSNYHLRPRSDRSDVALCFAGHATITALRAFP